MEDKEIISLYLDRNERAIEETAHKYGKSLKSIALRILADEDDGNECVNDTYLRVWNTVPPTIPTHFSAFLHRIARSISIDRYRARKTNKQKASEYTASLEELQECIAGKETPQECLELQLLTKSIETYLKGLKREQRQIFLCRYYFMDPIKKIAQYFAISEGKVKSTLFRIRCGLKEYLQQEGFFL